jgi:hypothetical protein
MQEDNDVILANALLSCYLDDASTDEMDQVCARYNVTIDDPKFYAAIGKAMNWLDTGQDLNQLTPQNAQKIVDNGIAFLVQELGTIPGKDISPAGDGGFLVSNALMSKIRTLNRSKEDKPK